MKTIKTTVMALAALAAMVGWAGESAEFRLDTMDGPRTARAVETIAYSTAWNNGGSVSVAVDGVAVKTANAPASGDVVWNAAQATPGTHTLTHTCGDETLTAVFEVVRAQDVVVHFNANGGVFKNRETGEKVNEFDQYFAYGVPQKLFTDDLVPLKPDENGNQFLGWVCESPEVTADNPIVGGRAEKTWYDDVTEVTYYAVWSYTMKVVFCNNGHDLVPASLADHLKWRVVSDGDKWLRSGDSVQVAPGRQVLFLDYDAAYGWVVGEFKIDSTYAPYYNSSTNSSTRRLTLDISNDYRDKLAHGSTPSESKETVYVNVTPKTQGQKCGVLFKCAGETVPGQTFVVGDVNITLTYKGPNGEIRPAVLPGFSAGRRYDLPYGVYEVDGQSRDGRWVAPSIRSLVLAENKRDIYLSFHYQPGNSLSGHKITLNPCGGTVDPKEIDVYAHGGSMEVPLLPMPGHTWREFRGWWTQEGGKGRKVVPGTTFYGSEVGDMTLYAHWETFAQRLWDKISSFAVKTASIDGTTAVTLTSDVSGTIEIPDNISALTIDLNGHSVVASGGAPGDSAWTKGEPAIRIVKGDGDGGATQLTIVDTSDVGKGRIAGGGKSAGIEMDKNAASGVRIDVEDTVNVFNGDGTKQSVEPTLEPVVVPELCEVVDGAASTTAASEYNGYLIDAKGNVGGSIQVKVGKPNAKTGLASVKATVVGPDGKKKSLKAEEKGKAEIAANGPTTVALAGGEPCEVTLGAEGLSGSYGAYRIDGARNLFASKDKGEQGAANDVIAQWLGTLNVVWDGGVASVSIAKKGKAKVTVTLANGTKATANTQLLIGEEWLCVPVVVTKKTNLAFTLWLPRNGGAAVVEGLPGNAVVGKPDTLRSGAKFHVDKTAALWSQIAGDVLTGYLPDGVAVESGARWTVAGGARAGKVAYRRGTTEVDTSKLGGNPSALKLSYKTKDGSFKGSFKVYAENGGRLKATTVNVAGVVVDGIGYGTATVKNVGSVPIVINRDASMPTE